MGGPKALAWYRAALGSGHYPLPFNFVLRRLGKHIQCSYCGRFIHEKKLTRDHVYPKSKQGLIKVPACNDCNIAKEDKLPIEWAVFATENDIAFTPLWNQQTIEEEDNAAVA